MKNITLLLFIGLLNPQICFTQSSQKSKLHFEVNRILPFISITKEELKNANRLIDLNQRYDSSWIKKYHSVEILTTYQGQTVKSNGINDMLTKEQKLQLVLADVGSNIFVKVKYIPNNKLNQNELKEINFSFRVNPVIPASFPGGKKQLLQYIKEVAISFIPANYFKNYDLTAIKFTVNEDGEIANAHVFGKEFLQNNKNEIDILLLKAIQDMPCWNPAEYSNGSNVAQDFVLTVGNMENCNINLLNIKEMERNK